MPKRLEPFINDYYYHIFNRFIDNRTVFKDENYSQLFIDLLRYYQSAKTTLSFSRFDRLDFKIKSEIIKYLEDPENDQVEIIAYCLMPTHFHLLLKQKIDGSISKYLSDVTNSFTRTYNLRNKRKGPLFFPRFKSVSVVTDEQFLHVSRYIHLNPYSSGIVKEIKDIASFSFSSMKEYCGQSKLCNVHRVLDFFKGEKTKYIKFVLDNADYQKSLEYLKYSEIW